MKFVLQLAAGALAVVAVGAIEEVPLPGARLSLGLLGLPLTLFWLVGFSNGFNFMDGIDGIAALHAGIAALAMGTAARMAGAPEVVWLAVPLGAACLAFLSVNWSPARVFMGDVGSLPVGFLLALCALMGARNGVPFVTSFLILGPFLFDTLFTLSQRLRRGENVLAAHRSHLYQRLNQSGWSHARVAAFFGLWTVFTAGLGHPDNPMLWSVPMVNYLQATILLIERNTVIQIFNV